MSGVMEAGSWTEFRRGEGIHCLNDDSAEPRVGLDYVDLIRQWQFFERKHVSKVEDVLRGGRDPRRIAGQKCLLVHSAAVSGRDARLLSLLRRAALEVTSPGLGDARAMLVQDPDLDFASTKALDGQRILISSAARSQDLPRGTTT